MGGLPLEEGFCRPGHARICAGLVSLGSRDAGKFENNEQSLPEVCCERMEMATDREGDLVGFDGGRSERFRPCLTVMRRRPCRHVLPIRLR